MDNSIQMGMPMCSLSIQSIILSWGLLDCERLNWDSIFRSSKWSILNWMLDKLIEWSSKGTTKIVKYITKIMCILGVF